MTHKLKMLPRYRFAVTVCICFLYSVCGVHGGGEATEGDPEEAGGEEAGRDQKSPSRPNLLQVRKELQDDVID